MNRRMGGLKSRSGGGDDNDDDDDDDDKKNVCILYIYICAYTQYISFT
jgi:hypothetical protein